MLDKASSSQSQGTHTGAQAEPVSNAGSPSIVTHLRKSKKCCAIASGIEERENTREMALQTPRPVKECKGILQALVGMLTCRPC